MALPMRARWYLAAVAVTAGLSLIVGWFVLPTHAELVPLLLFVCLGSLAHAVRVPSTADQTISFSSIVHMAAIPVLGIWGAVLAATISAAASPGRWPVPVRLFNAGQMGLSTLLAAGAYVLAGGSFELQEIHGSNLISNLAVPMVLATVVHCCANCLFLAGMVHFHKDVDFRVFFTGLFRSVAVTYIGYGMFGLLLAVLWGPAGIGPLAAVLVLAPLYVARWAWAQYAAEQEAYERTVLALVGAVEAKDLYTRGHNERVSHASVLIARQVGLAADRVEMVRFAGMLHDVGKIGVPTRVLRKSGRLTDEEFAAIALHPVRGLEMVRGIEFLEDAYSGILHHHERLDGKGYPMGLSGEDIPELARIIAVADAFDSMTSTRSYRRAREVDEALVELEAGKGTQFEPRFVDALVAALEHESWEPTRAPTAEVATGAADAGGFDHDDPDAPSFHRGARPLPDGADLGTP